MIQQVSNQRRLLLTALVMVTQYYGVYGKQVDKCRGPLDIIFVLDSSSSIWPPDFTRQLKFVEDMVDEFDVGPGDTQTRVGALTFSDTYYTQFNLNSYQEKATTVRAIRNIPYSSGSTNTGQVIKHMASTMFDAEHGGRNRTNHVAVVITDGRSQDPTGTARAAEEAKKNGVLIFAIGVGKNVDEEELRHIASEPASRFMFRVMSYRLLQTVRQTLLGRACEVSVTPPVFIPTHKPWPAVSTVRPDDIPGDWDGPQHLCGGKPADIVFLLDSSTSVYPANFMKQLQFVQDVIDIFDIGSHKTRVAVSTFSDVYKLVFDFKRYTDKTSLKTAVKRVPYLTGGTDTAQAIRNIGEHEFSPKKSRTGVARVLIVVTDGKSQNTEETIAEAKHITEQGIYIFAIGIGPSVDASELDNIASTPSGQFAFYLNTYDVLHSIKDVLAIRTCQLADQREDQCGSNRGADVLFAFDAARVGTARSQIVYRFISQITQAVGANSGNLQFGILSETCATRGDFPFSFYSQSQHLQLLQTTSVSDLGPLLKRVRSYGFSEGNGGRASSNHVAVLFLDSRMNAEALLEARQLVGQNVTVFVVAIGGQVDLKQARWLSGLQSRSRLMIVADYRQLLSRAPVFRSMLCKGL